MRAVLIVFVAALFAASAAAQAPLIGEHDTARPGGVYTTLTTSDPATCARLCAEDGICMAWTFRASSNGACELKAVAPAPVSESGARSGLSARAPAFARRLPAAAPETSAADLALAIAADDETALLGGPVQETRLALRPRLGGNR